MYKSVERDEYYTPKSAWEAIRDYIPKDKIIWEAFNGDGSSANYLKELGFTVINQEEDFFENDRGDVIVTNSPFSKTKEIFARLKLLGKPFILILPQQKLNTKYIREIFKNDTLQIIIPKSRIHFVKPNLKKSQASFDCFYYCYKLDLKGPNIGTFTF